MIKQLTESAKSKKKQIINIILVITVVSGLLGLLYLMMDTSSPTPVEKEEAPPTAFDSPTKKINTESHFQENTEKRLLATQKMAEEANKKVDSVASQKNNAESARIDSLTQQLEELKKYISEKETAQATPQGLPAAGTEAKAEGAIDDGIQEDTLELVSHDNEGLPEKNPGTYVPSGTFVSAVMLGGADASTAVTSQSNPSPMLFRIVDHGTLPNGAQSNLKDCVVTAAVSGDISSERGKVRLETLSCTRPNSAILDIAVKGTIFGNDGKNGVRGKPLWREGALLQRAFFAGTLSGFSNALSQKYTTTSISPLGATQNVNSNDIWSYGAAKGAGNAMDKLAEYNIKRAEQYHPVIQLSAGAEVDIVFLEGFYINGKKRDDNSNTATPQKPVMTSAAANANPDSPSPLPLTEKQITRLRERQQELGFTRPRNITHE